MPRPPYAEAASGHVGLLVDRATNAGPGSCKDGRCDPVSAGVAPDPTTPAGAGVTTGWRRVVIFDAYPGAYGGAQRVAEIQARHLPEQGWAALVITPGPGRFVERLRHLGLAVEVVAAGPALTRYGGTTKGWRLVAATIALPGYWLRLTRRLRRLGPSVLHVADLRGMLLAAIPARLARARVVWHDHGGQGSAWANRLVGRWADAVVVPSRWSAVQLGFRPRGPVEVVVNPVDDQFRVPRPPAPARSPVIVALGRLHPNKGFDDLIRAAVLLEPRRPGLQVVIGGDDDPAAPGERQRLAARVAATALAGRVELVGFVERPADLLARAAVYVQPSRFEPQGLAILEAMAVGIPVVASAVGGIPEVVRDGVNGLLVRAGDPVALAAAIERLLGDVELSERLRQEGCRTAGAVEHTPAGMVATVVGLYERLTYERSAER